MGAEELHREGGRGQPVAGAPPGIARSKRAKWATATARRARPRPRRPPRPRRRGGPRGSRQDGRGQVLRPDPRQRGDPRGRPRPGGERHQPRLDGWSRPGPEAPPSPAPPPGPWGRAWARTRAQATSRGGQRGRRARGLEVHEPEDFQVGEARVRRSGASRSHLVRSSPIRVHRPQAGSGHECSGLGRGPGAAPGGPDRGPVGGRRRGGVGWGACDGRGRCSVMTGEEMGRHPVLSMAGALAFFAIFGLPPLAILLLLGAGGSVYGSEAAKVGAPRQGRGGARARRRGPRSPG